MALSNKDFVGETLGCGSDRTAGRHAGRHRARGCGRCPRCSGCTRSRPTRRVLEMVASIQGVAPADAHGEGTGMTASELVAGDSSSTTRAARPGDIWLPDRSWSRPSLDGRRTPGRQGGPDGLGGAARAERGRDRRLGDRQHLAAGRRPGRRADRARLRLNRRHRDPGHRRRCPRRQPRTGAARAARTAGKGEALWRSLAATSGDIVVFVDSDLIDPHPMFVPWLVGPLLTGDGVHLVKASTAGR